MMVIPAIDIKAGRCVRLRQGKMHQETVYSDAPEKMARAWEAKGARLLHVVDLDGAVQGTAANFETIKKILQAIRIPVQVGGGLRSLESVESYLKIGAARAVLGTSAILDFQNLQGICERFPQKIVVAIDSQDGRVAIKGWQEISDQDATELAKRLRNLPIAALLVTDIHRDGMLTGPNLQVLKNMSEAVSIPVIASGGIRSLEDIKDLLRIKGLYGVIIGRALYEGLFDLSEAIALAERR